MNPGARLGVIGWVGVLGCLLWVGEGWAGLFCVTDFAGRRCSYPDVESCRRAAGRQGGCELNVAEMVKPIGGAPFCLVESWRTHCIYPDRVSCEQQAAVTRTVCVAHPNQGSVEESPEVPAGAPRGSGGVGASGSRPVEGSSSSGGYLSSPGYQPGIEK
ncbi:MAG: hypothetical protein HQL98_11835 [Magnetococcales bacterium]|nr:hypothetical protein [Magnetococcales bacterium]